MVLRGFGGRQDALVAVRAHEWPTGRMREPRGTRHLYNSDIHNPQWAFDNFFYLAFLPNHLATSGPLGPLALVSEDIPIRQKLFPNPQNADEEVLRFQLEPWLGHFYSRQFFRAMQCIGFLREDGHKHLIPPHTTLYSLCDVARPCATRDEVRALAFTARRQVLCILALLSWFVALHTTVEESDRDSAREEQHRYGTQVRTEMDKSYLKFEDIRWPSWYVRLAAHHKSMSTWAPSMWATWVFDLSFPRLGGLVPITRSLDVAHPTNSVSWIKGIG